MIEYNRTEWVVITRREMTKPCHKRSEGTDCEAVILRAMPEGSQRDSSLPAGTGFALATTSCDCIAELAMTSLKIFCETIKI